MKIIYQRLSIFAIILSMTLLSGCRQSSLSPSDLNDENSKEIKFSFSVKGDNNNSQTTGESEVINGDKKVLTAKDVKIHIFKEVNEENGEKKYKYYFTPTFIFLNKRQNYYYAHFKIPEKDELGPNTTGKLKLLVLVNYTGTNDPKDFDDYEAFNKSLIVDLHGKYDPSVAIPYWGTHIIKTYPTKNITEYNVIGLLRCMARINLQINEWTGSNKTYKIASIESARFYRTSNKATLYVDENNLKKKKDNDGEEEVIGVTSPTMASDWQFNLNDGSSTTEMSVADKQPLLYEGNINQMDFFVPEKEQSADKVTPDALKKAMAIVVGVKLKETATKKEIPETRYYRVDIAEYKQYKDDDKSRPKKVELPLKLKSILRNHFYQILLEGAWSKGEKTPDDALNGSTSLFVTVKDWANDTLRYDINGQYIFGIQSSNLQLPWKKNSLEIPIIYTLTPENAKNAFSFSWKDSKGNITEKSERFKAEFDIASKKLKISTKKDNPTNDDITEQLSVRFLKHSFTFKVTQLHKSAEYIIAPTTTVKGVYVYGKPNPSDNKVTFRLYAKKLSNGQYAKLDGLRFHVASDTIEGYSIVEDGTFNALVTPKDGSAPYQMVTAQVSGIATQPKDKILTLKTDADQCTYATAKIPLAFRPKKVLVLYGPKVLKDDKLYFNNKDFKELMKGNDNGEGVNFGLDTASVVKAEPITFVETTDEDLAKVINSEHPDIIIHSKEYELDPQDEDAIIQFMNSNPTSISGRGVFISTNTENVHHLLKFKLGLFSQNQYEGRWMDDTWFETKNIDGTLHGTDHRDLFPIREYPPGKNKDNINLGYRYRITNTTKDKLINGPFGDIGGLWWRAGNGSTGRCITFPIKDKILQYSGMVPFGSGEKDRIRERYDYGATFLRAQSYPLVWIGFDNLGVVNGNNDHDAFAWGFKDGKPINTNPMTYYCVEKNLEPNYASIVSSDLIIANMLYWALYTSEYGI